MQPSKDRTLADLTTLEAPSVIMVIGVPGSGKSYFANQVSAQLTISVLSSDKIREELTGDETNQSVSEEAWTLLYTRAEQAIKSGVSIIIDGTHTVGEWRQRDIEKYRSFGAKRVIGLYVQADLDSTLSRNASRSRNVPEHVIKEMHANLNEKIPSAADGYDYVIYLDNSLVK